MKATIFGLLIVLPNLLLPLTGYHSPVKLGQELQVQDNTRLSQTLLDGQSTPAI